MPAPPSKVHAWSTRACDGDCHDWRRGCEIICRYLHIHTGFNQKAAGKSEININFIRILMQTVSMEI